MKFLQQFLILMLTVCGANAAAGSEFESLNTERAEVATEIPFETPVTGAEKKIAVACHPTAVARLQDRFPECAIESGDVAVIAIDSRWYNPSKYVWYRTVGGCPANESMAQNTVMIQFYRGACY